MWSDKGLDRPAGDESMRGVVSWDAIENLREYLPLHEFEMVFG